MSWEANNYVNALTECPDGAELTRGQKCLLLVLSNFHNSEVRAAWPSMATLSRLSLASEDTTRRDLGYMQEHCLVEQRKPERQGRGKLCSYVFLFLDDPDRMRQLLQEKAKGLQNAPLFSPPERVAEGSQIEPKRVAEGSQGAPRNKDEVGIINTDIGIITPDGATTSSSRSTSAEAQPPTNAPDKALKIWLHVKGKLEDQLPADEVKLWVKPARLQRLISNTHMLIALPPSNRIMQAAHKRREMLRGMLKPAGYNMSFVKYADEIEQEEIRDRFGIEVQQYGKATTQTNGETRRERASGREMAQNPP
ncbi:MAG: hypothetical protein LAN64_16685 [Acidobacteriia bacterium]|nr:hypothetical protein [Terriglobia bacterium]